MSEVRLVCCKQWGVSDEPRFARRLGGSPASNHKFVHAGLNFSECIEEAQKRVWVPVPKSFLASARPS